MKIFSDSKPATPTATAISSIIGQDMTIVGDLTFQSKIQLDGNLQGNLTGTHLVLSETGRITGDVVAETVVCFGHFDGNVTVGKLFLKKSGVINGRVETSDLSVESGGILNGEIKSQSQPHLAPDIAPESKTNEAPASTESSAILQVQTI